jgi:hypothetical protein
MSEATNSVIDFTTPDKIKIYNLRKAIEFYAARYHDERHTSDSFRHCLSEVCVEACRLLADAPTAPPAAAAGRRVKRI